MTEQDIATYYRNLNNGNKGRFVAFLSVNLGGTPSTWQQKILRWGRNNIARPMSPIVERELKLIVEEGRWKTNESAKH